MKQILIFAGFLVAFAFIAIAEPVTLKSKDGYELQAEIVSATEDTVKFTRLNDGEEFDVQINTLAPESRDLIREWLKKKRDNPTYEFKITSRGTKYDVSVNLPKGEYNNHIHPTYQVTILFDSGKLQFFFITKEETPEETKKIVEEERRKILSRMTPSERKEKQPKMIMKRVSYGDAEGYILEESDEYYGRIVIGDCAIRVKFTTEESSTIERHHMPDIISSLKLVVTETGKRQFSRQDAERIERNKKKPPE